MDKKNSVVINVLRKARVVFWDFDGVIKDSVEVKTQAFLKLFSSYGEEINGKVKGHHEANGGMSRFKKIPLYLEMAGQEVSDELVDSMCDRFSMLVFDGVINADWIPGVENYLRTNPFDQRFILVSATPQSELEVIVDRLNLAKHFNRIYGAPNSKTFSIRESLISLSLTPDDALMIGDASADQEASEANKVPFLLRRHASNCKVFADYQGLSINDFSEI
jgi:phosphoglycolate phosphatase-like HAD superfamily hydrolase